MIKSNSEVGKSRTGILRKRALIKMSWQNFGLKQGYNLQRVTAARVVKSHKRVTFVEITMIRIMLIV